MTDFVHLHLHTEYSMLDGACKIDNLIDRAKREGVDTVCITDHGNMYGALQFAEKASRAGLKYIIGCEFYVAENHLDHTRTTEHLVLLAKNKTGYKNLCRLNSTAFVEGFYYKPRIDMDLLRKHSEGLICLSACLAGGIPRRILAGDEEGAKKLALEFQSIFGSDFYIEIQDHDLDEDKYVLPRLVKLAAEVGAEIVATNDVHYLNKEDARMQDILMCIQTGKKLDDPNRIKFQSDEFYFKTGDEMAALFCDYPYAIENTRVIANKIEEPVFDLDPDKGFNPVKDNTLIPMYTPPDGMTSEEYLRKLTEEGLKTRYGNPGERETKRANDELEIICSMAGYADYFLVVWDFINWSKQRDIPVGPGRGSGVSSIVAYAIGITDVEPLRYDLFFERFLNPYRVSMPDFDIDFCTERREETIEYVREKYGRENVCQIVTFSTMAAKNAVRDVARVMDVPLSDVNRLTKALNGRDTIATHLGLGLEAMAEKIAKEEDHERAEELRKQYETMRGAKSAEFCELYASSETYKEVIDTAMMLESMPRQTGVHAAGVVICQEKLSDHIPLAKNGDDVTTQFTAKEIESLGMLKMDFLALVTLTDIKKCTDYIEEDFGVKVDFEKMGEDDPEVYQLIADGDTDGVFQLEAGGMKRFMRNLRPDCIEDLIAGVALYRPGPMANIDSFCRRKRGEEKIVYDWPAEEKILGVTYGVTIYQEQVMQLFQELAGFSLGEADLVRRAMGKKNLAELLEQRQNFVHGGVSKTNKKPIKGCVSSGIPENVANRIFDNIMSFASYAFNKSHAAAYATLAYRTAWLKKYYCKEFICALLNNRLTKPDDLTKYLLYLKTNGYDVLPSDINRSYAVFKVEGNGVRFGLCAIKGIGRAVMDAVCEEREKRGDFKDFSDFVIRCVDFANPSVIERLIFSGAFDSFKVPRSALSKASDGIIARAKLIVKQRNSSQMNFFSDVILDESFDAVYPDIPEFDANELLAKEKQLVGMYLSGHPFEKYASEVRDCTFDCSFLSDVVEDEFGEKTYSNLVDGMELSAAGIVTNIRRLTTKKGQAMCSFMLEDVYGSIECVVFPAGFEKYRSAIQADAPVRITGNLKMDESRINIAVNSIEDLDEYLHKGSSRSDMDRFDEPPARSSFKEEKKAVATEKTLWLNGQNLSNEQFEEIVDTLAAYPGDTPCKTVKKDRSIYQASVHWCKGLAAELGLVLSDDDVVLK